MYCRGCGKELSDGTKFCMHCGAVQDTGVPEKKKMDSFKIWTIIAVISVIVALVLFIAVLGKVNSDKEDTTVKHDDIGEETWSTRWEQVPETEPEPETEPQTKQETPPENGWYYTDIGTYYYEDGVPLTGLQECDGMAYYFDDSGLMMRDTEVDINGNTLVIDWNGIVTRVVYADIGGTWSDEKFEYGNSGRCSIRELNFEVEDCTELDFYIEAEGNYGAKTNGEWLLYIRSNGNWEQVATLNFQEPSGTAHIRFSTPKDFDAITAHPTVQGNASYSCYYTVRNVDCNLG